MQCGVVYTFLMTIGTFGYFNSNGTISYNVPDLNALLCICTRHSSAIMRLTPFFLNLIILLHIYIAFSHRNEWFPIYFKHWRNRKIHFETIFAHNLRTHSVNHDSDIGNSVLLYFEFFITQEQLPRSAKSTVSTQMIRMKALNENSVGVQNLCTNVREHQAWEYWYTMYSVCGRINSYVL